MAVLPVIAPHREGGERHPIGDAGRGQQSIHAWMLRDIYLRMLASRSRCRHLLVDPRCRSRILVGLRRSESEESNEGG